MKEGGLMDKIETIVEKLHKIEINQAVTHTKLEDFKKDFYEQTKTVERLERRVDAHDKIVGAIALCVTFLGIALKFKII